ncbi:PTS sugar transporter subunit IIA [Type-E symbiont of Plautia stali]|uniref:PTS sugar transporter subunit IIA n=1 Tax=Type-E symbiont of Plautia stali TaxID=1560357 RepID=UPI00256FF4CD|nr:PTS sugar transporter subunit IIA [Type-E symbiont of Plautia stali]
MMLDKVVVSDILSRSCVVTDLVAGNKVEVIEYLSQLLFAENIISDKALFIRDVLAREELGPTGFDNQVAIPHGKSPAVRETRMAVAQLRHPVDWETEDEVAVRLVILFAVRNADSGIGHIKVLASVSVALGDDEIVEQLMQAESREALYRLIVNNTGL